MSGIIGQAGSRSGVIPYGEIEYEKGAWSPTIVGATISSSNFISGSYTKIGRLVSIFAVFDNITLGSVSGYSYITNFPFTCRFASVGHTAHNTMCSPSQFYLGAGNTSALATGDNTTGSSGAWNAGSSKYMIFQATYTTD